MDTPPAGRDPKRSRMEDEVIEILQKSDRPPSNVIKFQSKVRKQRYAAPSRMRTVSEALPFTSGSLLVATVVLALAAFFAQDASELLARVLAIASVASLVGIFVLGFKRPQQAQIKTWRGRDVSFGAPPSRPAWLDRWMGGPRR